MFHRGKAILIAGAVLMIGGCVVVERTILEIRIRPDRSASYLAEFHNLQSDATSAERQQEDFRELLNHWRGDNYLLEAVEGGRHVLKRELVVERGVVVGRESGLFRLGSRVDFPALVGDSSGVLRMRLEPGDSLVSSNGTWLPDSGQVVWPAGSSNLRITMRDRDFAPTAGFAEWLRRDRGGR